MYALLFTILFVSSATAFTPYTPADGWTYYIEAAREGAWPSCQYRFISWPNSCDQINLWSGAGTNQQLRFIQAPGAASTFYLKTSCGRYLSYAGSCDQHVVDTWPEAGVNQAFKFSPAPSGRPYEYIIEAVGRQNCPYKWLSFPVACTTNRPDTLDLWSAAGTDQTFRIHPVSASHPPNHKWNSATPCADPFAFYSNSSKQFELLCTSHLFQISFSPSMGPDIDFKLMGEALTGNNIPHWAQPSSRWAPENIRVEVLGKYYDVIFWANGIAHSSVHRIGWVASNSGPLPKKYVYFAPDLLNLGGAAGGDIDAHVFHDTATNAYYLVWKSDDNNAGMKYTRIWAQQISFSFDTQLRVHLVGSRTQILDSSGLWWSTSWVEGGSLIEGPEIVKNGDYYYLFFASGRYCEDSYSEGVARSRNVLGPYEKMLIPLLSTGIVGNANGQKLLGPGHASFVQDSRGSWNAIWHASTKPDSACSRFPFVSSLKWTSTGWPYADF